MLDYSNLKDRKVVVVQRDFFLNDYGKNGLVQEVFPEDGNLLVLYEGEEKAKRIKIADITTA